MFRKAGHNKSDACNVVMLKNEIVGNICQSALYSLGAFLACLVWFKYKEKHNY